MLKDGSYLLKSQVLYVGSKGICQNKYYIIQTMQENTLKQGRGSEQNNNHSHLFLATKGQKFNHFYCSNLESWKLKMSSGRNKLIIMLTIASITECYTPNLIFACAITQKPLIWRILAVTSSSVAQNDKETEVVFCKVHNNILNPLHFSQL